MKTLHLLLIASVALTACNDDNQNQAPDISGKTYDSSSGLELYYNGAIMPGKTVKFSQSGNNAEITAFSEFDLSQLSAFGLSGEIPAPGIIPGNPVTRLNTSLTQHEDGWIFSGDSSDEYCTYSYSGFASADKLIMKIDDANLKSVLSPSVWTPSPIIKNDKGGYTSLPFYIDWQFNPLPDTDIDLNAILTALTTLPVVPVYNNTAYMSLSQALTEVLRTVAFRKDGNIIFTYINNSFGAARIDQTQPNGYQYVMESPDKMRLFINPLSLSGMILNNSSGGTPADEVDLNGNGLFPAKAAENKQTSGISQILGSQVAKDALKDALEYLLPQLASGFPLSVSSNKEGMQIFIDTDTAITMVTKILIPIICDLPSVKAIEEYFASDPELVPLLPYLKKGIELIPMALERTTTFRFGFSFVPYTE